MTDLPDNDDSSSSRSASTNSSTESPSSSLLSVGINDLEPPTPTRPPVQQSRNRVIRHVQSILREHYLCFVLIWILLVLALAITTFVSEGFGFGEALKLADGLTSLLLLILLLRTLMLLCESVLLLLCGLVSLLPWCC